MSNTIFYQLLDRELPGVIDHASYFLNRSVKKGSSKTQDIASLNEADHRSWDPLSGERTGMISFSARLTKLQALREQLGRLSLAYAITQHRPFAESAQQIIRDQIIRTNLLSIDDWNTVFRLEDLPTKVEFRICMVEIVLSLELLHNSGALQGGLLDELNSVLRNYLIHYDSIKFTGAATQDKFAWALESLVIALFLNQRLAAQNIRSQVEEVMLPELDQLFSQVELNDLNAKECDEFVFATECFFAINYWTHAWSSNRQFGAEYYSRFEKLLSDGVFKSQLHGAWDSELSESISPHLLSDSSLFLFLGEKVNRPEIVSLWIQKREQCLIANSRSDLITHPLLWFPNEEWNYEPFVRNSHGEMAPFLRY